MNNLDIVKILGEKLLNLKSENGEISAILERISGFLSNFSNSDGGFDISSVGTLANLGGIVDEIEKFLSNFKNDSEVSPFCSMINEKLDAILGQESGFLNSANSILGKFLK